MAETGTEFDRAVRLILQLEGGSTVTKDPDDPGGTTKYGISKRAHPERDIESLTEQDAIAIYWSDYWMRAGCDKLPWPLALIHFDCAVNQGVQRANGFLHGVTGFPEMPVRYLTARAMMYMRLPGWAKYGKGWINRLFRLALAAGK